MPTIEAMHRANGVVRYRVRVRNPDPAPGKSGFTSATFATEPEAERFVRDCDDRGIAWALAEYHRDGDGITVDEWAARHFDALTEASGDTIRRYRSVYKATWSPLLGGLPIAKVTRSHVATALNTVTGTDKTRKNKWAVLTHLFKTAMYEGHINRSPCLGIKVGRTTDHEREEHRYLTHDEFAKLYAATPDHWKPLVLTAAGTGARWGELAALEVGDVDLDGAAIRVTKAVKQDPNKPGAFIVGPTKTKKSRRTITLPSEVVEVLRPLIENRARTERLFLPPEAGQLRHRTFYMDIWMKKCAPAVDSPAPRFHDLRHSHVAWLIAAGVNLAVIQARLGHEKITTTIDTYGHLLPDLQTQAAQAASLAFSGLNLRAIAD